MNAITIKLEGDAAQIKFFSATGKESAFSRAEASADAEDAVVILDEGDLLEAFSGPQLAKVYNSAVAQIGETDLKPTKRFSTPKAGASRVMKALDQLSETAKTEEAPAPAKPAETETETETEAPAKPAAPKTSKPAKQRKLSDKVQEPGANAYNFKFGTVGASALNLIRGGIHVDDLIKEMNAISPKGGWTRGNAWSSLRYILHTNKGWGLKMENEIITLIEPEGNGEVAGE